MRAVISANRKEVDDEAVGPGSEGGGKVKDAEVDETVGPGSEGCGKVKLPPDLLDLVLSWTLEDIFNEELYKHQIVKIPETFPSVDSYMWSYVFPLLEETRAVFHSSMETILDAPYSEIVSIEEEKPFGKLYDMRVRCWKNENVDGCKEIHKPIPYDIFILSNIKPDAISDLNRYGSTFNLCSVIKVEEDGKSTTDFKVRTSKHIEFDDGMKRSLFLIFMRNITTEYQIWKALGVGSCVTGNLSIIKDVLSPHSPVGDACGLCSSGNTNNMSLDGASELNDSQISAILGSISEMQCTHKCSVKLIWGPPGTGKTRIVSELLWALLKMKCKVLTCTPTYVAVLEVTSRLLNIVKKNNRSTRGTPLYQLGDILLFEHVNHLKIDVDLCEVFLDYRVDRLVECFDPSSGWYHQVASMIDFLNRVTSHYHLYLEREKNNVHENIGTSTFLEFFQKRYRVLFSSLETCTKNLCTHLATSFISRKEFEDLITLLYELGNFKKLLSEASALDNELQEIFKQLEENRNTTILSLDRLQGRQCESSLPILICKARSKCLSLLKAVRDNIVIPCFHEKNLIRDFCLQNASLIFCTATTSFELYSVQIQPLDLIIIDEASQLKECESTIPLRLRGLKRAVLIGDENQLTAMIKSKDSEAAGLGRSLFQRLSSLGISKHLLEIQYRMHPSICLFPNVEFYSGKILDGPNVRTESYERRLPPGSMFRPFSFINVTDGVEEVDAFGRHSSRNMVEVGVVLQLVKSFYKDVSLKEKVSIGIVSPYPAQVSAIQEKLGGSCKQKGNITVKVKSIDGFQGGEEDVMIISMVISNGGGSIRFLPNRQSANVALTRARYCLLMVGNGETLVKCHYVWEALVCSAKNRGCYFDANQDKVLAEAILNAKKDDHIDDLLNSDSILVRGAKWKVLFSENFRKSFAKLKSLQIKKDMIQLLLKLADGWRPRISNLDLTDSHQLTRVYRFKELYLTWSVDIMKRERYIQVLKVWDLLPIEETEKLLKRLDNIFSFYTNNYVDHCKTKQFEGKLEVPFSWNVGHDVMRYKKLRNSESVNKEFTEYMDAKNFMENSKVNESLLLMKFFSLSSGIVKHLLIANDGSEMDIPFELTDEEEEIIHFPYSSFILGRSGTGKTTVLTMKIIQKEQQQRVSSEGFGSTSNGLSISDVCGEDPEIRSRNFLKQIFVTVSPKLCSAVKNHVCRLMSFASGTEIPDTAGFLDMHDKCDTITEFLDIPDNFHHLQQKHYPLIITFQKFLVMLDGTMTNSYFDKFYGTSKVPGAEQGAAKSLALQAIIRSKEVTYERFVGLYWPHFNMKLTKKLDPCAVYTQIISHIKGGLEMDVAHDVRLCKEDYARLSERRVSTLSRERREMIYDIFLDYEKMKQFNGEFDLSDLVMDLHHRLHFESYMFDMVDFVYIDEVQDLTMRQIALFKHITRNFQEGFVFAGDTAQTIARGIDFRFEDIRSLFYKEFVLGFGHRYQEKTRGKIPCISDNFQLQQNFRTHAGVLNLAQSIVDLLYEFFPISVDKLSPEISLVYGEAPVLLNCQNSENAIITIFGGTGRFSCIMKGFGADQVVLVRDECSKEQIIGHIGKQALVLTIMECKGLEFQDVLLYNFFGASPLKNQWRVIYGYMKEHFMHESTPGSFPSFDEARHSILCSELKQLYVAITRTRQRLWICETIDEYSQPVFDYWKSLCLVQTRHLDSSLAETMRTESSPEEWRSCGIKLFNEGNFEMATLCFERAGDDYRETWARAAGLRATADRIINVNFERGQTALKKAAELYESIGKAEKAASCFIALKDFKTAGTIFMEKCGASRLESAGDCFAMAECWSLAAEAYSKAKCFSKSLTMCTRGALFDFGLNFIEQWRKDSYSDERMLEEYNAAKISFLKSCAVHYYELGDIKLMMVFVKAFDSMDQIRDFLKSKNLLDELLMVEVESGNYLEAISISRMKGDILFEADMFEKVGDFEKATELIIFHVLSQSLWIPGSKGWPIKHFEKKDELLDKAKTLAKRVSCSFYESTCIEVELLSDRSISLFDSVKYLNHFCELQNVRLEILIARKILDVHLQTEPSKFFLESEFVLDKEKHVNEMMNQNQCSTATMVYFWNFWKKKILDVLSYLCFPDHPGKNGLLMYKNFCLMYFGVREEENSFIVLDPEAKWLKDIGGGFLKRSHNLIRLSFNQFATSAQNFWTSELSHVGTRVLDGLQSVHNLYFKKDCSLLLKGNVVLLMFEVVKFLSETKLLNIKHCSGKIEKSLALSKRSIFDLVFPLDWTRAMTEDMITLRESDPARQILAEVLEENLSHKYGKVTHGQIGRLVMILFVTGRLTNELFQKISPFLDHMQPWRDFINALKTFTDCGSGHVALVCEFQKALESTFETNWRRENDYISPHCFMYLIECLAFMASSCLGNPSFYTTKSTLFEMLSYHGYKEYMGSCFVVPTVELRNSIVKVLHYISGMVQMLLKSKHDIQDWIKKSCNPDWPCESLVLRLVIVLSLVHLNSGSTMSVVQKLLSWKDIYPDLPVVFRQKFYSAVSSPMGDRLHFVRNFSEALRMIGNSFVVVCCQDGSKFSDLNAVVVNSENLRIRDDVLPRLFPKVPRKLEGKDSIPKTIDGNLGKANLSIYCENQEVNSKCLPTISVDHVTKKQWTEIENGNDSSSLRQKYDHFWETLLALQSEKKGHAGDASSTGFDADKLRLEAEAAGHIIHYATTRLKHKGLSDDEKLFEIMHHELEQLELLSQFLEHSSSPEDLKSLSSTIEESCAKLQELRPRLQPFMDLLIPLKDQGKQVEPHSAQTFPEETPCTDQSGTVAAADSGNLHRMEAANEKFIKEMKSKATNQKISETISEAGCSDHKGKETSKSKKWKGKSKGKRKK